MTVNRKRARRKRQREKARNPKPTHKQIKFARELRTMEEFMDATDPMWRYRKGFNDVTSAIGETLKKGLQGFIGAVNSPEVRETIVNFLAPKPAERITFNFEIDTATADKLQEEGAFDEACDP